MKSYSTSKSLAGIAAAYSMGGSKYMFPSRSSYGTTQESRPHGQTKSLVKVVASNKRLKAYLKSNVTYHDSYNLDASTVTGRCRHYMMGYIGTSSQMTTPVTFSTASWRGEYSFASWYSLNPLQGTAAGTITNATSTPSNDKMGIGRCQLYFDMINATNNAAYVKVHFWKCLENTNVDPLYWWDTNNGVYNTNFQFSAGANSVPAQTSVNNGNADGTYTLNTLSAPSTLSLAPYTHLNSKRVVGATWKKLKTVEIQLNGADTHRLTALVDVNVAYMREQVNLDDAYMQGCVAYSLELQGAACVATDVGITTGAPKIGIAITRKVELMPMKAPNARMQGYYQAECIPQNGAATNTKFVTTDLSGALTGFSL